MKYKIQLIMDSQYGVYLSEDDYNENCLFSGSLSQVNAWLSLKEKGYDLN